MIFRWICFILPALELAGQTHEAVSIQVRQQVTGRPIRDGQVTTVYLAPRYATAIRMPEPVNSVVVGDPASFSAEHSDREPQLVFVKPITPKPAQSNLLISTTRGLQVSLLLVSRGEPKGGAEADIDFLMRYKPSGQFIVQPAETLSAAVPQTATLPSAGTGSVPANGSIPVAPVALRTGVSGGDRELAQLVTTKAQPTALDDLLDRQRRAPLPTLYGQKPGVSPLAES